MKLSDKPDQILKTDQTQSGGNPVLTYVVENLSILFTFLVLITVMVLVLLYLSKKGKKITAEIDKNKLMQTKIIVYAGFAIIFLLFVSGVLVHAVNGSDKFLINLSITIIISWIVLLITYYAWAIYFYNINMGWSDDKWKRYRNEQEDPTAAPPSPNENPHKNETLGLPPGTVRGTIALTLLVGALALTIGSFGMDNSAKSNMILVDNFDFYKKAFLMMIAFYFGAKSLEILQNSPSAAKANEAGQQAARKTEESPAPPSAPAAVREVNLQTFQKDFTDTDALG
jgi:protein-S-isoprenylcysteine O-methyltransferase Ste14